jgi:gliding motility-associated lipoprotein GldD
MKMKKISSLSIFLLVAILLILYSCREIAVPKPKGYFRIDFPKKNYIPLNESDLLSHLPLIFEYPSYGKISQGAYKNAESGFFNIEFPAFKAIIYLTYKDVKGDLPSLIEQTYTMNVKNHVIKADAIDEQIINNKDSKVYGILYDLKGNTATAVQFYVTDSIKHYLRGSLYFESEPNADSLAPVIDFFREDIIHLIETLEWEKK